MFPKEPKVKDTDPGISKAPDAISSTNSLPAYLRCIEDKATEPRQELAVRRTTRSTERIIPDRGPAANKEPRVTLNEEYVCDLKQ